MDYKEIILHAVCRVLNVDEDEVLTMNKEIGTRKKELVHARQLCMYFARQNGKESLSNIGKFFGERNHVTVIHAIKTVKNDNRYNIERRYIFKAIECQLEEYLKESTVVCKYDSAYDYPSEEISATNLMYQQPA